MASDSDIQFGDVAEDAPRKQIRPDANSHFTVRTCGTPHPDDLPVFLDLDALKQMELHALSDTSVELGGVMLGSQLIDDAERPFVVVNHALSAEHYESTKGSFKFTHETWSDITRQRATFPAELRIVGWYHTHPDWGVFLSGMDTFICENFFNKPLDIALVIDPCRGDRGVFYWAGTAPRETRRAAGFHVMTSRFRQAELDAWIQQWEQEMLMAGRPGTTWGPPPGTLPYVPVPQPTPPWLILTLLGSFFLQFALLAVLVWRLTIPPAVATPASSAEDAGAQLAREVQRWMTEERRIWEADAKLKVVDRLLATTADGRPNVASELADREQRIAQLEASLQGLDAARLESQRITERRTKELEEVRREAAAQEKQWTQDLASAKSELSQLGESNKTLRQELAGLRGSKPAGEGEEKGEGESALSATLPWSWWIAGGALVVVLALCGGGYGLVVLSRRRAAWERGEIAG